MKKTNQAGITGHDPEVYTRRTPSGVRRPAMPTLTDPVELEHARRLSMRSTPPERPAAPVAATPAVPAPAAVPALPASPEALRLILGPLDRVPEVRVPREQLRWLSIDHRTGFVLSLVDGVSTAEMILDVSGMPEIDALRILAELVREGIVAFR